MEQWEARGGRYSKQVSQYFTFTVCPLTKTSLVLGSFKSQFVQSEADFVELSKSGGFAFLGTIPGSLADVKNRNVKSNNVRKSPVRNTALSYKDPASGILENILEQNVTAGDPIRKVVKRTDCASGPNTNLPPHKNLFLPFQT